MIHSPFFRNPVQPRDMDLLSEIMMIPPMIHSNINTTPVKVAGAGREPMTKGEYRVGVDFNPSGDANVILIKRAAADLIDLIESLPKMDDSGEVPRLKALAMTAIEDGAMWAVKACTKKPQT
jgi:hypothetical protein